MNLTKRQRDFQENAVRKVATHVQMAFVGTTQDNLNPATLRMALQAPAKFRSSLPKNASYPIIWDSGASLSISPNKKDFVGPYTKATTALRVKGLANGLRIEGRGHVLWSVLDVKGQLRMLKVPAYHVPGSRVRLLSTTSLMQTYPDEDIVLTSSGARLSGCISDPTRGQVIATIDPTNNLPTSTAYDYNDVPKGVEALSATINTTIEGNYNLSEPQKELLRWHHRLGHSGFRKIQFLFRSGVLARTEAARRLQSAASKLVQDSAPKCAACQYGKQSRRPSPGKISSVVKDVTGALTKGDLVPGQRTSVDHFICSTKGRLFTSRGKTSEQDMYTGGCIFVDHSTAHIHVEFQKHLNSHETLRAKEQYEALCRDYGVVPQTYQSDNGSSFTSSSYAAKLAQFEQITRFAGAGAHHHNGTAERAIQTIMASARTMMLHAAIHWPDVADPTLWPMAVQHAVYLYNRLPDPSTGIAPIDLFTRVRWVQRKFHDLHVWGCPVYVLDKTISDGKKLPRWKPRSQRCINMGLSADHASTVPLVLNPGTGSITAQFHVVFDDWFATIATSVDDLPDFNSPEWSRLFGDSMYQYEFDSDDEEAAQDEAPNVQEQLAAQRRDSVARAMENADPPQPLPVAPPPTSSLTPVTRANADSTQPPTPRTPLTREPAPVSSTREPAPVSPTREPVTRPLPAPVSVPREPVSSPREPVVSDSQREMTPVTAQAPRRSARVRASPDRFGYDGTQGSGYAVTLQDDTDNPGSLFYDGHPAAYTCAFTWFDFTHPAVFAASSKDPDTLTYDEAMSDPDVIEWRKSANLEIRSLEEHDTWIEVPITEATSRILPGTWVFRRKRNPDGVISKYKGRYCVRGDLQEGEFETFAPVVAWSTVRLFLVLTLTLDWYTCSVDFSNAFVQAELQKPIWIHLPRGFRSAQTGIKTCLRLKKSLYGLTVAPRLWYQHLFAALLEDGFTQSVIDPCLLHKKNMLVVVFVDDCGIAAPSKKLVDDLVARLRAKGFELTQEGSFSEFLGIKFEKNQATGTITMTQKGLIQKVIAATGMEDCNPNWTPASTTALGSDPEGEPMTDAWNYRSVVGMLLYLTTNTRPDIAFAVSQVARFSHDPKKSHATALKTIVRYLARTWDKGMIVKPTGTLELEVWADADFAGLYRAEPDADPISAKSRGGHIINLGGCPLVWKTKIHTEIAQSTLEAEYQQLSLSMRTLLPLRRLLIEVVEALQLSTTLRASIHCRVFEDNNGALLLATNQRITSRTKYMHVKWHFFWSHVNENDDIEIVKISTHLQRADFLTKGLVREVFEKIRKLVLGW